MTTTMLRMLALPFDAPALVRDAGPDGQPLLFREVFGRDSFDSLPEKVPLQRMHERGEPIGWATPKLTDAGLEATGELLDTVRARDTLTEVGAGLMSGVSVGFVSDPHRDRWSMPTRSATLPQVMRRGAQLVELSLVPRGAYAEASVLSTYERDAARHAASEAIMAPVRAARAQQDADRRAAAADLAAWVDGLTNARTEALLAPIPPAPVERDGGLVVRGQTGVYLVEGTDDVWSAEVQADIFERQLMQLYRAARVDQWQIDRLCDRLKVRVVA